MKKSHRKDVIIARIIFAFILVALTALIVFGVKGIMKYRATKAQQQGTEANSQVIDSEESQTQEVIPEASEKDENDQWIVDVTETEDTQTEDAATEDTQAEGEENNTNSEEPANITLKAMYGVNIRSGAGTDHSILGAVAEGDCVTLLEEGSDGWGYIQYGDLTGYVYLEYFLIVEE